VPLLSRVSVSATANAIATGFASPNRLSATRPASIPRSGLYIVQSRIEPYRWSWVKCYAVVFNASVLA
jgi:hypothetical protein